MNSIYKRRLFKLSVAVVVGGFVFQTTRTTMFRNVVWYVKGQREYTKAGYETAAKKFVAQDLEVDATGKSYMITGANSGIGKETALEIARRGGTVHMLCRSVDRGHEAKKEIHKETKNANIHVHHLDLSDPVSVHHFCHEFDAKGTPLHVLVNNAGCMVNERVVTQEGLEWNFATNTLGTFILTEGLLEVLRKFAQSEQKPRVITVSSGGMLTQKLDISDLMSEKGTFDGTMVYAQQKRQQVVLNELWAKKYKDIQFSSMHPGWADTPAVQNAMPDFYEKMKDNLRTPAQGADTVVWLALSQAATLQQSGLFYQDRESTSTHLPLAWTKSGTGDEDSLYKILEKMSDQLKNGKNIRGCSFCISEK